MMVDGWRGEEVRGEETYRPMKLHIPLQEALQTTHIMDRVLVESVLPQLHTKMQISTQFVGPCW